MSGVPIPVISELLGHSDIATTMIYAHLSPEQHQAAAEKLVFSKEDLLYPPKIV